MAVETTILFQDDFLVIKKNEFTDESDPPKQYGGYEIEVKDKDAGYLGDMKLNMNSEEGLTVRFNDSAVFAVTPTETRIEGNLNVNGVVTCTDIDTGS